MPLAVAVTEAWPFAFVVAVTVVPLWVPLFNVAEALLVPVIWKVT